MLWHGAPASSMNNPIVISSNRKVRMFARTDTILHLAVERILYVAVTLACIALLTQITAGPAKNLLNRRVTLMAHIIISLADIALSKRILIFSFVARLLWRIWAYGVVNSPANVIPLSFAARRINLAH